MTSSEQIKEYDLEDDIKNSPETIALFADDQFCKNFWGSFANVDWIKFHDSTLPPDQQIIDKLTEPTEGRIYGKSFRGMGAVIARIRNEFHGKSEDYIDWYCTSSYGEVYEDVVDALEKLGWKPYKFY